MIVLKILLIISLFLSDFMILYSGLKYTASHGDPKAVEYAKMQLIWSFYVNLFSVIPLLVLHIIEGFNFSAYAVYEWVMLSTTGGGFLLALSILLINFLIKEPSRKVEEILLGIIFFSILVSVGSFHLFLSFIQF